VKTTVVICTYADARLPHLRAAIDGVRAQEPPVDELVLVVDHNPALAATLRSSVPDAVVVENAEQRGLSGARNTGLAVAAGDVVAFLDDDAVPRPGWLGALVAPLEADPGIAGVGGAASPAWEAGARPSWFPEELDWVVGCSFRGQAGQGGGDVRNPIGCSMAFRASTFAEVGGFVHSLGRVGTVPLGCEETELGLRVNRAGGRIVLADTSVVDHFVPRSRGTLRYVLHRCYAEGISKSVVRRLAAGTPSTLGPEQRYALTMALAVLRAPLDAVRARSLGVAGRAVVIPAALIAAAVGFARGELAGRRRS